MAESRLERERALALQLRAMGDSAFELLVFELAKHEPREEDEEEPERLAAPDGGADVIVRDVEGRAARVWQAKHHTTGIGWDECAKSLDRAAEFWQPREITFVFPVDVSARSEASWIGLVEKGRAAGIKVRRWTLSDLLSKLAALEALRIRFFGEDGQATAEKIDRAIRAGHPLESTEDMIVPARAIATHADTDKFFELSIAARSSEGRAPKFDDLPYLSIELPGDEGIVRIDAWGRTGIPIGEMPDNVDGLEDSPIRKELTRSLASGEDFELTVADLRRCLHPAMRGLAGPEEGSARVEASDFIPLEVEIRLGEEVVGRGGMKAHRVLPRTQVTFGLAGWIGNLLVELDILQLSDGNEDFLLAKPHFDLLAGGSADANQQAAAFLEAWFAGATVSFSQPGLLPFPLLIGGPEATDEGQRRAFRGNRAIALMALELEKQLEIDVPLPEHPTDEDCATLRMIADTLRDGRGSLSLRPGKAVYDAALTDRLAEMHADLPPVRVPMEYQLFGRTLVIGVAAWKHPGYTVGRIRPRGDGTVEADLYPKADSASLDLVEKWQGDRVLTPVRADRDPSFPAQSLRIYGLEGRTPPEGKADER